MASPAVSPRAHVEDVKACSFTSWYPTFSKVSLRAMSIHLSNQFVDYLNSNKSLVLPPSHSISSTGPSHISEDYDESDFDVHVNEDETEQSSMEFPEIDREIMKCVEDFDGAIFPKLNWSAPQDAAWISFNKTLKCASPSDVYLLLKSSDMIVHDLQAAFSDCDGERPSDFRFHLVLKKWYDMHPEREFRCFVRSGQLVAFCQRHRLDEEHRDFFVQNEGKLVDSLQEFFDKWVKNRFPRDSFIMDAYWTKNEKWRIIDFNPFSPPTDPRLFTWKELEDLHLTQNERLRPHFRFLTDCGAGIIPNEMQQYGLPVDIVDLTTGSDPQKFMDLLKESVRRQNEESSSDED